MSTKGDDVVMPKTVIAYDLRSASVEGYTAIIEEIRKLPQARKLTESLWMVEALLSSEAVKARLAPFLSYGDRLFVGRLTEDWTEVNPIEGNLHGAMLALAIAGVLKGR